MPSIQVYLLQRPRILLDGVELHFSYKKMEALLYYLLTEGQAERSSVIGLLWDDADSPQAYQNLRHALYSLRRELGFPFIESSYKSRLQINPELTISCDLWDFLQRQDLDAYQGAFLQDFTLRRAKPFDEWREAWQVRLHDLFLKELGNQAREAVQLGDVPRAIRLAQRCLEEDPTDESMTVLLMRLYRKEKQFVKATTLYQDLARRLEDELGITPLKETTSVYYEILNTWNNAATQTGTDASPMPVGKKQPRKLLHEALARLRSGQERAGALLLQGEPGVGKSFLLEHARRLAQEQGIRTAMTSCYPTEQDIPLRPWYSLMMQVCAASDTSMARLCPGLTHLDLPGPHGTPDVLAIQEELLTALAQSAQRQPFLLIFEDIHWMDPASLLVLHQVLRRLRNERLFVLCSCGARPSERTQAFLYEGRQDGLLEVRTIRGFSPEETREFLSLSGLPHCSPELADKIYAYTGGNALKIRQLLPALTEEAPEAVLEKKLEQLFLLRLNNLLPESRQLLDLISIFPEGAPFSVLRSVTGRSRLELLCICDDLERRLLIEERQEGPESVFSPTAQIQPLLARQLSRLTGRILHLRVADCLEHLSALPEAVRLEQCAYHFSQGGEAEKAAHCRLRLSRLLAADSSSREGM